MRTAVEGCYRLSLSQMLCEGHIKDCRSVESVVIRNHRGLPVWTLTVEVRPEGATMEMFIRDTAQYLTLTSTPLHFGGWRWWFLCPACARRCADLYQTIAGRKFYCRLCLRLTYRSSEESHCTNPVAVSGLTRRVRLPWRRKRDRRPGYQSRLDRLFRICGIVDEEEKMAHIRYLKKMGAFPAKRSRR